MREKTCIEIHVFMSETITIFSIARGKSIDFYLMFLSTHKFKEIEANKKLIKQL